MDLNLTPEQDLIIGMVRRFVREEILPLEQYLDPDADELEDDDRQRLIAKTREMGLYGLDIPPEYGGPDIDLVTRTLLAVEMSQHRAGLYAPCYGTFGGAGLAQLFEATEQQKSNTYILHCAAKNVALDCRNRPVALTPPVRSKLRRSVMATTG